MPSSPEMPPLEESRDRRTPRTANSQEEEGQRRLEQADKELKNMEQSIDAERIKGLNERMARLREGMPEGIRAYHVRADMNQEFGMEGGRGYVSCELPTFFIGVPQEIVDRAVERSKRRFEERYPDLQGQANIKVVQNRLYMYAPIEVLERCMDRTEARWTTREIAAEPRDVIEKWEREREVNASNDSANPGNLTEAPAEYTQLYASLFRQAAEGLSRTCWGRLTASLQLMQNRSKQEEFFVVVPAKVAPEFRLLASQLFGNVKDRISKRENGDYAVQLTKAQMRQFVRDTQEMLASEKELLQRIIEETRGEPLAKEFTEQFRGKKQMTFEDVKTWFEKATEGGDLGKFLAPHEQETVQQAVQRKIGALEGWSGRGGAPGRR